MAAICGARLLSVSRQVRAHLWHEGPAGGLQWDSNQRSLNTFMSRRAGSTTEPSPTPNESTKGSRSDLTWLSIQLLVSRPVMRTALSLSYISASTKSNFSSLVDAALNFSATCSRPLTGWYSSFTNFVAGTIFISAATSRPMVPYDHGIA